MYAHAVALQTGGLAGIINENSLRSAIARPYSRYFHSIAEKAAAMLEGVVRNHGFADGNKRTAILITSVLVKRSGFDCVATEDELLECALRTSTSKLSFEELTLWFQRVLIES